MILKGKGCGVSNRGKGVWGGGGGGYRKEKRLKKLVIQIEIFTNNDWGARREGRRGKKAEEVKKFSGQN